MKYSQQVTLIYAVLVCLVGILLLQFLLLTSALDAFWDDAGQVPIWAALGSGICFLGSCILLRYLVLLPGNRNLFPPPASPRP